MPKLWKLFATLALVLFAAAPAFAGTSPLSSGDYTGTDSTDPSATFPFEVTDAGLTVTIDGVEYYWDSSDDRYEATTGYWFKPDGNNGGGTYTYGEPGGSTTDSGTYSRNAP